MAGRAADEYVLKGIELAKAGALSLQYAFKQAVLLAKPENRVV